MRLRFQLAITLASLTAVATSAASIAAYRTTTDQVTKETDAFLESRLGEITSFGAFFDRDGFEFGPLGGSGSPAFGGQGFPFARPDANTTYLNTDGTTRAALATVVIPVSDAEQEVAATGTGRVARDTIVEGHHYRLLTIPLVAGDSTAGAIQLSRDTTESHNLLDQLRSRLMMMTLAVTAVAAAVGWALALRIAKPLEQLRDATTAVAQTKTFDTELHNDAGGEVGQLTDSFNTMLSELEDSRRRQHQLVQDANHELRTPLATLSANLELLERTPPNDSEHAEILREARSELTELTDLTDQLSAAASAQYNLANKTMVPVKDVTLAAIRQIETSTSRSISLKATNPANVYASPDILTRAIVNLLTNANKHTPSGTRIEVSIDVATIVIRDHGPGIADADLSRIFEPFYRADTARSLPGSGLGLALVKQIVGDHDATVTADNHPQGGAQFTIRLPARH